MPRDTQQNPNKLEAVPPPWPSFHICFRTRPGAKASAKAPMDGFDPCSGGEISTLRIRAASRRLPHSSASPRTVSKWDLNSPVLIAD